MLKTLSTNSAESRKSRVGVGGDSKAGRNGRYEFDGIEICNDKIDDEVDNEFRKKGQKTSKSKNLFKSKKLSKSKKTIELDFFTLGTRLAFTELRQAFVKAPIFHHFDSEYHIYIKTNAIDHAIGRVFSLLTLDDLGQ